MKLPPIVTVNRVSDPSVENMSPMKPALDYKSDSKKHVSMQENAKTSMKMKLEVMRAGN